MGQKVNPHGARVGVIYDWSTRWYAGKKDFANNLNEDFRLRKMLKEKFYACGISRIDIERSAARMTVTLYTGKPGMIIGRNGKGIEDLRADVEKFLGHAANIRVMDVKNPDADAQLIAENIAQQLEKRIAFRRAMKQSIQRANKAGAKGVKVAISGRLGGADIARTEHYHEGSIPLQTLRANIDYGFAEAKTTYGRLGVKVWVYKGQVLPKAKKPAQPAAAIEGGK
ncbi:MAG: 30S ribosomal protein S3 [Clostridiales bacterium]|jgi:small subunit ribosomal protein S3|nr:30S ribosomal protein S3 [Clostridiales bacterium]